MSSRSINSAEINESLSGNDFMLRCIQLSVLGAGFTAPNPVVGAVLVHNGMIIGEGYHEYFGGPHAEVNCLFSVKLSDRHLIPDSTLYVSLEPCVHHGKTPPCTDLLILEKISKVVIGCRDPFSAVNGKGIEKLIANGIQVEFPFLEELTKEINCRFFTFHVQKRPYIILKWAQSSNHKMAGKSGEKMMISNEYSNRLVHKWRSEEAGIMIGTNTALSDNPELTNRLWTGKNPVRIVLDKKLKLPDRLKLFDGHVQTIVLNESTDLSAGKILFKKIDFGKPAMESVLSALHSLNILSVLVEGGANLLRSFIDDGLWDEIRIITNRVLEIPDGIPSPELGNAKLVKSEILGTDTISYYKHVRK
jgi:diaminohydroxyphosphoribosylaminopyrimidine deaminase / 5-amino-6-(5-phosphoribosylamino)uracil reductase